MKILAVCGAGMGTSVMMKIKLTQFLQEKNITDVDVESCGLDEAKGNLKGYDIIICTTHLASELGTIPESTKVITANNIMKIDEYGAQIIEALSK